MLYRIKKAVRQTYLPKTILFVAEYLAAGLDKFVPENGAHEIFARHGYHLLRKHFYLPIPDRLEQSFWERQSEMVGVDLNGPAALRLIENDLAPYIEEFRQTFPNQQSTDPTEFYLLNGAFMAIDAHIYYALVRHLKPQRIIEVGAGFSTILAGVACKKNQQEQAKAPQLTAIEPYPGEALKRGIPGLSQLIEKKIEELEWAVFKELRAGDILFIDTTHVLKAGGDVQLLYCEILPRLAPGVVVHIHDISLPRSYPKVYFEKNHYYWNEQYLLQAFLAFNSHFEVLWPGNYMMIHHPNALRSIIPEFDLMREQYPSAEPTSFWIRVRG